MHLVAAPAKLSDDIPGEKAGIAPGYVYVCIFHAYQAVEDRFKFTKQLHFVKQDIVHTAVIFDAFLQMRIQNIRIPQPFAFKCVKCDLNDMVFIHTLCQQMPLEQRKEQIRFTASAHTGDDLDKTVVFLFYERIQVVASFDFHVYRLLLEDFTVYCKNLQ